MGIIAGCSSLLAQDCQSALSGTITDQKTKEALVSAKVEIVGTDKTTYTDFEGNYSFEKLCKDTIHLKVSQEGYQEQIVAVLIDGDTEQNVKLGQHKESLAEVVVRGTSVIEKSKTSQEQSISSQDIDKFSSQSMGDALKNMSGVSTLKTGKSIVKPVIQGLSSSRVPILNNGTRMEDQEWGAEHAPNIDLNATGKLTVVKGAGALQYGGDAIGGVVINEHADIPRADTLYGKTILSGATNGRGGSATSSLTKSFKSGWYINAQGTYKKFGDYEAPNYKLTNTGTNERDFSVDLGLNRHDYGFDIYYSSYNNHLGVLRASNTGSVSDLVHAINSKKPTYIRDFSYHLEAPRQKVQHHLVRAKLYKRFDNLGKLTLNYNYQENDRLEYDVRRGKDKNKPSVDLNLKTHSAKANFDFDTRDDYDLKVGADGHYKLNYADPSTGVQRIIPNYKQYAFGAFATGNYTFNRHWLAEAGARYDYSHIDAHKWYDKTRWDQQNYDDEFKNLITGEHGSQYLTHPVFHYNNISATAGIKYSFYPDMDVRLNYAMSNRAPNPSESFSDGLHHSSASLELGELRLDSEHSHKVSLAFEKDKGDFTFTLSPYFNYIDNYINSEPDGLEETVRGSFLRYQYQQVNARLLGLDVDLDYQFNKNFAYQGKFSTVDGRETGNSHRALIDIPATNMSHAISYQNQSWHQLAFTLRGEATFRKKHYPDDNFTIRMLEDGKYQDREVDISTPPKGYFLTGLDASAVFHPYARGSMEVRLSFDNIFDVSYRDYLNRLRYYAANTGRNISLQLKFTY